MKIAVTNLKGGVGKTTLSTNLAVCFAHMDYSVCIVDSDFNQNSYKWYLARDEDRKPEIIAVAALDDKSLNKIVDQLHQKYDVIIIDGTPKPQMSARIMVAADLLFVPIRPNANDIRAFLDEISVQISQVSDIKEVSPFLILNEYSDFKAQREAVAFLKTQTKTPILHSSLKSRTAYSEASVSGIGVFEHTDDKAKLEIAQLTKEIIALAKKQSLI